MGRVINPESAGKERTQLQRAIILAIRELMQQSQTDSLTQDLAAFIALALEEMYATIDHSVEAWEKRGYWVKADRFRMDWDWTRRLGAAMRQAVLADNWVLVAQTSAEVAMRLKDVKVPQRHRLGTPWVGGYARLKETKPAQV